MDKTEGPKSSQALTMRPMVLHGLPPSLRTAWEGNREKLTRAGVFAYLAWIQSITRVAFVERVAQFVQTHSEATETAQVDGRTIDFSVSMIGRRLKLPTNGQLFEDMPGLTKHQYSILFEGEFPPTSQGCPLENVKPQWKAWFHFVNEYLFFRPKKEAMTQKMISAAMVTWHGQQVNWAQVVQQQMLEEIAEKRGDNTKAMELYSTLYISVLCEEMPSPAVFMGGPSSPRSSPSPSPSPSPEKPSLLAVENQHLREQLLTLQTIADQRHEQVIAKGEALVQCQTNNVKTLSDLAQAMREKMESYTEIEALKKAVEAGTLQIKNQSEEVAALKDQLQTQGALREELRKCRDELEQMKSAKQQVREPNQQQSPGMELQRKNQLEEVHFPGPHVELPTVPSIFQSVESLADIWQWESKGPMSSSLFQLYERQRDLFFLTQGLAKSVWLDHSQFLRIWQVSVRLGVENPFTEILARKHLQLSDPHSAFLVIGDVGARVLMYYASLEGQWSLRRELLAQSEERVVSWQDYSTRISSQFYGLIYNCLNEWQIVLSGLYQQLSHPDFVSTLIANNVQRLSIVPSSDLNGSHYLFQYDKTINRLERYIRDISANKRPLLNLHGQVQLESPPPSFTISRIVPDLPLAGSPLTLKYLGQYHKMFDDPSEEPVLTWSAISWLLEDYGLSRTETIPADIQYRRVSRQWSPTPPPAVINHPNFCPCARRYKWNPHATLTSIEYNWPLIPGPKATASECQATYRAFFEAHRYHLDPVCFRAAVFCNTLANWCGQWNVTIDVNQYSESQHEFLLLLKLQYRPTRWVRIVEAMAITHFIAGAHKCLINKFPNTRAGPFERFLKWQRLHAPEFVEKDDDLRKAVDKMEIRDNKRAIEVPPAAPGLFSRQKRN